MEASQGAHLHSTGTERETQPQGQHPDHKDAPGVASHRLMVPSSAQLTMWSVTSATREDTTKDVAKPKPISEIAEDSEEETFLGTVNSANAIGASALWLVKVKVNGEDVEFKVDTGADVTVIPERIYSERRDGELQPSSLTLHGPTGESLKVCGQFSGSLSRKSNECQQDIYVMENLHRPLLGRPALQALRVVALVEPIQKTDVSQFPEVFKGLGKLKDNYVIKLRENATP